MIYADDSTIKIDSILLPGIFKSIEVKGEALIDEQEIEGQGKRPKQATGYEDIKVNIELILEDSPEMTGMQKLEKIQQIFRVSGQDKPAIHEIINEHTAARGVKKVIFKGLTHKSDNKKGQLSVSLEFLEYVQMTISAVKLTGSASNGKKPSGASASCQSALKTDYKNYLNNRGAAPGSSLTDLPLKAAKLAAKTPARDNVKPILKSALMDLIPAG